MSLCHFKQTLFVPDLMGCVIRFLWSHVTKAYLSKRGTFWLMLLVKKGVLLNLGAAGVRDQPHLPAQLLSLDASYISPPYLGVGVRSPQALCYFPCNLMMNKKRDPSNQGYQESPGEVLTLGHVSIHSFTQSISQFTHSF